MRRCLPAPLPVLVAATTSVTTTDVTSDTTPPPHHQRHATNSSATTSGTAAHRRCYPDCCEQIREEASEEPCFRPRPFGYHRHRQKR